MSLYLCTSVLSISCQKCHWSFVDGLCKTSDPSHLIRIHNSNLAQLNGETLKSKIVKVHVCETNFCFQFAKSIKTAKFSKSGNFPHKTAISAKSLSVNLNLQKFQCNCDRTEDKKYRLYIFKTCGVFHLSLVTLMKCVSQQYFIICNSIKNGQL